MIGNIIKQVFGSRNSRVLKEYASTVKQINALEEIYVKKSDEELKLVTSQLKQKYITNKKLDDILVTITAVAIASNKDGI